MTFKDRFKRVSSAPTNPRAEGPRLSFDVFDLYRGPVSDRSEAADEEVELDEKLRQAYFWIVNTAIISPHYDVEYNEGPPQSFVVGDSKSRLDLPSAQSYSSFVLLPVLTFATRRKCLFIGGPGRAKTASALIVAGQTGLVFSMSRKGDCWDNAMAESFFKTLKVELGSRFPSRQQARRELFEYIEGFYNTRRLHSGIGYRSPAEHERLVALQEAA